MHWLKHNIISPLQHFAYGVSHHWHVWRSAWRDQNKQPNVCKAKGKELEFLPAVLEIQESPPSPVGRAIGLLILTLFVLTIVWASIGEIDIIAIAQGKIIPSQHSKVIQPLETGVVTNIHVREGQEVKKGDVLVELDSTSSEADVVRLQNEFHAALVQIARLKALINGKTEFVVPEEVDANLTFVQQSMLYDQYTEYQARVASTKSLIEQRRVAIELTQENINHLQETVPLLTERSKSIKDMVDKNFVSRVQYIEVEEERLEKAQLLATEKKKIQQDAAALAEAKKQLEVITSEFNKTNRAELAQVETQTRSLHQEIIKAKNRSQSQNLASPIDGLVQQLAIHTVGGVVTPAQELMVIVPKDDQLEIEAWVENKDIGFVDPNQTAEIKIEAFPFTKYGIIDGEIVTLSKDAVPLEDIGYVYEARVSMSKSDIQVGNKLVNLSPGMNVSVEIKTGKRKLIEYFLSPLLRGIKETARER